MAAKPRREPLRRELALRGLGVLALILVLLGLTYLRATGTVGGDPEVSAQVRNAGGSLHNGSDVKIAGVIVGKVDDIRRGDNGGIRVGIRIRPQDLDTIPANVEARILPATVFGTTFVDLVVHDTPSKESLKSGAVIPADLTQDTLELQQALDDIDALVKALGPAQLRSAISSTAMALDGRGARIGRIVDVADGYLARVIPQLPLVRTDLRKLADNLELVDDIAPNLLDATRAGLVTARTVVEQRAAISAIITSGIALSRTTGHFLASNVDQTERVLQNGATLLDTLYLYRHVGITGGLATNIRLGHTLPTAIKDGFLQSDGILQTNAPRYYTAAERPHYGGAPRQSRASFRYLVGGPR